MIRTSVQSGNRGSGKFSENQIECPNQFQPKGKTRNHFADCLRNTVSQQDRQAHAQHTSSNKPLPAFV